MAIAPLKSRPRRTSLAVVCGPRPEWIGAGGVTLYFILFLSWLGLLLIACSLTQRFSALPDCSLTFPGGGQRNDRQRFARLPWRLAFPFARFLLSSPLRFLAVFHSVNMPNSSQYFQNIFTIKLIPVKYRYGITTFAIFRSSWRGAAFRTCGRAAPCGSTRALPPDPRLGRGDRFQTIRTPSARSENKRCGKIISGRRPTNSSASE